MLVTIKIVIHRIIWIKDYKADGLKSNHVPIAQFRLKKNFP